MSVGQALSAAREAAGLTLDDVSAATRIRVTVIREIERDDFSLCGGAVYARGHLRSIAAAVGIDPAPLLAEFNRDHAAAPAEQLMELPQPPSQRLLERARPRWGLLMASMALVAVCALVATSLLQHHSAPADASASQSSPTSGAAGLTPPQTSSRPSATVGTTTAAAPTTAPAPASSSSAPASSTEPPGGASPSDSAPSGAVAENGVSVTVKVTGSRCWLSVADSAGQALYRQTANRGESLNFSDPTELTLVVGAPTAVDLIINGTDVGPAGPATKVVTLHVRPGDTSLGGAAAG